MGRNLFDVSSDTKTPLKTYNYYDQDKFSWTKTKPKFGLVHMLDFFQKKKKTRLMIWVIYYPFTHDIFENLSF